MMRIVTRPRRLRPLGLALLAVFVSVGVPVALGGVSLARMSANSAVVDVPDTLLVAQWPTSSTTALAYLTERRLAVLEPTTGGLRPLLQGAQQPVVSPDGRELYFVQYLTVGDTLRTDVVTLASDTLAPLWTTTIASIPRPPAQQPNLVARAMAATPDHVYVATAGGHAGDPLEIAVLDRADGREQTRWRFDVGPTIGGVDLVAAVDGTSLNVLVSAAGTYGPNSGPPLTLLRVGLADGHEEARFGPLSGVDAGSFVWNSRPTPDGRALYNVLSGEGQPGRGVAFLDLATATVERLDVGFSVPRGIDFPPQEWGISTDGRLLYLVAPLSSEYAVVDLAARRVVQQAALTQPQPAAPAAAASPLEAAWGALHGLLVSDVLAKVPFSERLQVSPDGRFLYGIGAQIDRNGVRADGIWVIDTSQWQIVQHWLTGSEPFAALLGDHGRYLWVQEPPGRIGLATGTLHALDAASGAEKTVGITLDSGQIFTVADLYAEQYGRSAQPATADVQRAPLLPLAPIVVRTSPNAAISGDTVALEARFVDPASGGPLEPGQAGVQFEPPAQVVALVAEGNGPATTVQLDLADFGVYRGSLVAPLPSWSRGTFNVRVTAEWPDGARREMLAQEAFSVQPPLSGSDGRRYKLRVSSQPERPVAEQPALVRIAFVDADTGAPLTDETTLSGGAPAFVEGAFFGGGSFTKLQLRPIGGGVYEGHVRLFTPGPWRVMVTLGSPIDSTYTIGTLEAVGQ